MVIIFAVNIDYFYNIRWYNEYTTIKEWIF